MAPSNANLTPTTSRTNTPLPSTINDFSSRFPLLRAYHTAADPLNYLTATISSHSDAFALELTNFINQASQASAELHSFRSLHQDTALELDSLRLVNSDLQTQRDGLISALSRTNLTPSRSAEHPDPKPYSGGRADLPLFLSNLALKLKTNSDWYPTPQDQMAYTYSRLEGKAAGQLKHRIRTDGTITFESVEEILQILRQSYGDVDPAFSAQQRVISLRQNSTPTDIYLAE